MKGFKDLMVWQKGMDLAEKVYMLSKSFPPEENYTLTNQVRRSAISIISNIVEGKGRETRSEYLHFLSIAQGSLCETEEQLLLADRLGYVSEKDIIELTNLIDEIGKMLYTIRVNLKNPKTLNLKPRTLKKG